VKPLLDAITVVASILPLEKIEMIAARLKQGGHSDLVATLSSISGTPASQNIINYLIRALIREAISAEELSSMLLAAGHVYQKMRETQSVELVWTGPRTPFISPRRTEQALLEVINTAQKSLFMVSFVAYGIPTITKAIDNALKRGVTVSMLLELSRDHGGSVDIDALGKMKSILPGINLYVWKEKGGEFTDGRVHAKVATCDGNKCFITSANLTNYAMERNMEVGILISGGDTPQLLQDHLEALIETKIISRS
jgi:cardiolipin synthase A/B